MLLCSSFPHTREQRGNICWCVSPAGAWQYSCLLAIIQVCIGGRFRGAPGSHSGRQTVFFHMPVRGTVRIEPPTIKVVWPWEVWMTRAALACYEVLHWPPHSYARCAACEDTARAAAVASHLPLVQCDCSEEDAHTLFFSRCSVSISGYSISWTMLGVAGDIPATLRNNVFEKVYPN